MAALRSNNLRPQRGYFADADYDKTMAISPLRSPRGEGGSAAKPDVSSPEAEKRYHPNSAQTTMSIRLATRR